MHLVYLHFTTPCHLFPNSNLWDTISKLLLKLQCHMSYGLLVVPWLPKFKVYMPNPTTIQNASQRKQLLPLIIWESQWTLNKHNIWDFCCIAKKSKISSIKWWNHIFRIIYDHMKLPISLDILTGTLWFVNGQAFDQMPPAVNVEKDISWALCFSIKATPIVPTKVSTPEGVFIRVSKGKQSLKRPYFWGMFVLGEVCFGRVGWLAVRKF